MTVGPADPRARAGTVGEIRTPFRAVVESTREKTVNAPNASAHWQIGPELRTRGPCGGDQVAAVTLRAPGSGVLSGARCARRYGRPKWVG